MSYKTEMLDTDEYGFSVEDQLSWRLMCIVLLCAVAVAVFVFGSLDTAMDKRPIAMAEHEARLTKGKTFFYSASPEKQMMLFVLRPMSEDQLSVLTFILTGEKKAKWNRESAADEVIYFNRLPKSLLSKKDFLAVLFFQKKEKMYCRVHFSTISSKMVLSKRAEEFQPIAQDIASVIAQSDIRFRIQLMETGVNAKVTYEILPKEEN